jgi:orotidine-5'-phosphate decarboxylase
MRLHFAMSKLARRRELVRFLEKFSRLLKEKNSILCIGLDPAIPGQRKDNLVPQHYLDDAKGDRNEARLAFCFDIIEQTADYAIAAKPNEQYLRGLNDDQFRRLSDFIHKHGLLAIYDCKLGDIADTAESNLFWMHEWNYDAITVHTQQGNLGQITTIAHSYNPPIGIIALTLMSNPEAKKYMKESEYNGKPIYAVIAEEVRVTSTDGCVVGATGHVTEQDIRLIRSACGEDKVFLVPGVGTQKGDPDKVIKAAGVNVLINVGRDVIYSKDPASQAKNYCERFNELRSNFKS